MDRVAKKYFNCLLVITGLCCAFLIAYQVIFESSSDNEQSVRKLVKFVDQDRVESKNKTVLLWTEYYGYPNWGVADIVREDYLKSINCRWTNCFATFNRSRLAHHQDFDAIVFHATEPSWAIKDIPMNRSSHQLYIMATLE